MIRSSSYKQAPSPSYASLKAEFNALNKQLGGPQGPQLNLILTKIRYVINLLNSGKVGV